MTLARRYHIRQRQAKRASNIGRLCDAHLYLMYMSQRINKEIESSRAGYRWKSPSTARKAGNELSVLNNRRNVPIHLSPAVAFAAAHAIWRGAYARKMPAWPARSNNPQSSHPRLIGDQYNKCQSCKKPVIKPNENKSESSYAINLAASENTSRSVSAWGTLAE